jgi:hypothetical protein
MEMHEIQEGAVGLIYGCNSSIYYIQGVKPNGTIKTNLYAVQSLGGKCIVTWSEALELSKQGEYYETEIRRPSYSLQCNKKEAL